MHALIMFFVDALLVYWLKEMNPIILLFAPAPITVTKDLYNLKRFVIIHGLVLIRSISLKSILSYPYKSRPDLI